MPTPEDPQARLSAPQSDETPLPSVPRPGGGRWALYAHFRPRDYRADLPGTVQKTPKSVDSQFALLRSLAAQQGAEVVATYADEGPGRPARDRLVRDAFDSGFDQVAVTGASVLARTVGEAGLLLDGLDRAGVRLVIADAPSKGDAELRLLAMTGLAEWEARQDPRDADG